MNVQIIVDSVGPAWALVMAVCFIAVVWWAVKKRGKGGDA
jgi:cbb3-type cytochrome oxidase subunit 3